VIQTCDEGRETALPEITVRARAPYVLFWETAQSVEIFDSVPRLDADLRERRIWTASATSPTWGLLGHVASVIHGPRLPAAFPRAVAAEFEYEGGYIDRALAGRGGSLSGLLDEEEVVDDMMVHRRRKRMQR
jgi:hypothetical protein